MTKLNRLFEAILRETDDEKSINNILNTYRTNIASKAYEDNMKNETQHRVDITEKGSTPKPEKHKNTFYRMLLDAQKRQTNIH